MASDVPIYFGYFGAKLMGLEEQKISVIVPVFNAEKYLDSCVSSVLEQTYPNLELILVNDGSVDNSLDLCRRAQKKDSRVIGIDQPNQGVSAARSKGVQCSSGEWLCFLDSDDTIPKDSLENLYKNSKECDIVIGQISLFADRQWPYPAISENVDSLTAIEYMFWGKIHSGPVARLFKRGLFSEPVFNIPPAITHGEDFIMNYVLFQKAKRVNVISTVVYCYYVRESSVSITTNPYLSLRYCQLQEKTLLEATLPQNMGRLKPLLDKHRRYHRRYIVKQKIKGFIRLFYKF